MNGLSNRFIILAVAAVMTGVSNGVMAENKACLLEGSITLMGVTTEIKDCMENNGIPKENFLETCEGIAGAAAAMGAPPAKVSYLAACPKGALGACEGLFGAPLTAYYYKKDAQELADTKQGCLAQGGEWK